MNKELGFDINEICNHDKSENVLKDRLKGSPIISRALLWICHMFLEKKVKTITVKDLKKFLQREESQVRKYLELFSDYDFLLSAKIKHKGKIKHYILNRNLQYYKQFIPIAKEVLGIK